MGGKLTLLVATCYLYVWKIHVIFIANGNKISRNVYLAVHLLQWKFCQGGGMKDEWQTCRAWLLHTVFVSLPLTWDSLGTFLYSVLHETGVREIPCLAGHTERDNQDFKGRAKVGKYLTDGNKKCTMPFLICFIISYITALCVTEKRLILLLLLFFNLL